jgi:phosphatidylglycerol:prolipoprotein diacylglycerol transferase
MIPYFKVPSIHVFGPVTIHPFGFLVASGIASGAIWIYYRAGKLGLPDDRVTSAIEWVLFPGLIGAHVFEMLFYQTDRLMAEGPLVLLKFWDGISSYGGFLGALFGFIYFARTQAKKETLVYADILIQGTVLGWIFGRMGCTIAFDHPGELSNFFLAFDGPGGARHNLGFYELLFTAFVLFPVILYINGRKLRAGYTTAWVCLLYAPVRFLLDLMRATDRAGSDTRYFGLTFAHYCSILLLVFSVILLQRLRKRPNSLILS